MVDVSPFLFDCKTTEPAAVLEDLERRCRVTTGILPRLPEGTSSFDAGNAGPVIDATPSQLAHLVSFLARRHADRPYGKLVWIGNAAMDNFAVLNEAVQAKDSGILLATTPISLTMLGYAARRHFKLSQIPIAHELFQSKLDAVTRKGDLVVVDLATDEVGSLLQCIDALLMRGIDVVIFNVRDANFPNNAKLWSLCKGNSALETVDFDQSYEDAVAEGGGIGFVRLYRQNPV